MRPVKLLSIALMLTGICFLGKATAQIKIGTNGTIIAPASLLELESNNQGLLLPRLTDTLQINALIPPDGMLVYITKNPNSGLYIRKGGAWVPLQLPATNANLTGVVTSLGNVTAIANGVITNSMLANAAVASLTGTNTGDQTATTLANVAAGTIAAVTVQGALNELDTEKAPLVSPTFTGTVTAPTFVGTLTGNATTATSAGTVSTNANLTGVVTSTGNATAIANGAITNVMLANTAVANLTGTNTGDQTATTLANVAAGTIAAVTVQGALNELDTEKAPLASPTFTGTPSLPSVNKVAITAPATGSTLTILDGKTLTASNTLTFEGTDGSTLNVGTGGILGSNAYTNTAFAPLASPTFTGTPSLPSVNKVAITAPATGSTLTILDGKTLTASNTLTFEGTDGSTLNIGTGGTLGNSAFSTTLSGSQSLNFGIVSGIGSSADQMIAVTNAADSDKVSLGIPNTSIVLGGIYMSWVSSPGIVTIRLINVIGGSIAPAPGIFKVLVHK
jgi:hypothetical protein